ncbi:unnamed protein product [Urochloa humidicola]
MGTETVPPRAKKRRPRSPPRSAALPEETGHISPPPATAPGASGAAGSRGQQPPPPPPPPGADGEDDGINRINSLPNGVLGDIISLLPTKEGFRTQAVSRRWRPIWRTAPLNLDLEDLPGGDCDGLCATVARILTAHRGPGRYARIPSCHLHRRPSIVNTWLQSPSLDNLEELDFCYHRRPHGPEFQNKPLPPASTTRFSGSLRVLTLSDCIVPSGIAQALRFPELGKLGLEMVSISEGALHGVLAGCPKLVSLLLCRCSGFRRVQISCAKLRNLAVSTGYCWPNETALSEVVIQDAPCLERLLFPEELHRDIRVSVIAAPKLETLGSLYGYGGTVKMELGSTVIQGLYFIDSMTPVCSIKAIAVEFSTLKLDTIIELMRCFPCLEKMHVKVGPSGVTNLWRRKYRHLLGSLDIRLKKLVFLGYDGRKSQVNFATFFIMNAKMLETVTFVGSAHDIENNEFIAEQHTSLQLDKRASIGAQFNFKATKCGYYYNHINHVHDLSTTDPFECTC